MKRIIFTISMAIICSCFLSSCGIAKEVLKNLLEGENSDSVNSTYSAEQPTAAADAAAQKIVDSFTWAE